jgi:hypothetical protein
MPKQDSSGNPYITAFHDLMATSKDFTQFLADPAERQGIRQGFTDAVNRGAVAATLGAPVDMANTALNLGKAAVGYLGNKAGVLSADRMPQLIDNPVGGSEYIGNQMRRLGVVSPNRNALAEGLAGFLPTSPTTSAKAVAAIGAGGVVPGMDLAATVFHGSPHKFDRFDSSKIGTGEGAQAYGHGLYLADKESVADSYRYVHGGGMPTIDSVSVDGRVISGLSTPSSRHGLGLTPSRAMAEIPNLTREQAQALSILESVKGDATKALSLAANKGNNRLYAAVEELAPKFKVLEMAGPDTSLYKVDLPDEAIAKMLDWDKPLSQQAPEVQAIAAKRLEEIRGMGAIVPANPSGEYLHRAFSPQAGEQGFGQSVAAQRLRDAGIPGIRYLDAGSRGQGQGSSNYVVFPGEENMLRILERNGQALK